MKLSIMFIMPVFDIYDGKKFRRVKITDRVEAPKPTASNVKSDTTLQAAVLDPPLHTTDAITGAVEERIMCIKIGRTSDNHIILHEPLASRRHCEIRFEVAFDAHNLSTVESGEKIYVLHDLQSRNGTYLNDRLITEPTPLKNGDEIGVGNSAFRFWFSEDDIDPHAPNLPTIVK